MSDQKDSIRYAQEIAITNIPFDTCMQCSRKLIDGTAVLPGDLPAPLRGKTCPACGRFYHENVQNLDHYLAANYYLRRYNSSKFSLWVYAREEIIENEAESKHLHHLSLTPGAAMMLILQDEKGREHEICIVTDRRYENRDKNIIYCWTRTALVLLTYAFHKEHQGRVFTVKGKKCTVKNVYAGDDYRGTPLQAPPTIYLRKNGGFHDPEHPAFPQVIALVYSPISRHYEGMAVTHDTDEDIYYVDSKKFREFIHKHGNPDVHIGFYNRTGEYGFDWEDLKDSSFLMDYGYTVSYKDNLPDSVRHDMLAEIVDLQLASVSRIISHLDFCIATHANNKNAVDCWRNDKEFISTYKVNPQRFMIAGSFKK